MPYTQLNNLDFSNIKIALKEYMRAQTDFTDYDFDGSALSNMLDVLAYNTYYTAFNTNMVVNELYIDSATLRDNVIAIAKQLGYRPKSATSPTAYISFTVNYSNPTTDTELILKKGTFFLCDAQITQEPSVDQIVESAILSVESIKKFGIVPKIALLSHSTFGSHETPSAKKMRDAAEIIKTKIPHLEVAGELQADVALNDILREKILPNVNFSGIANLLLFPNLDAANIAFNLLKTLGDGLSIGPILVGAAQPVHILSPSVTTQGIVNMSALAAVEAQTSHFDSDIS